jgi:hypothetical protein
MAYCVRCDWCDRRLYHEDDYAELTVTIHHRRGKGAMDAKWAEEVDVTRHFCAAPKPEADRHGRDRSGLIPEREFDTCYGRAIAAITRTALGDPGMGLEWRLMPAEGPSQPHPSAPAAGPSTWIGELEIGVRVFNALTRAGIETVEALRTQVENGRLRVRQLGPKSHREIRAALDKFAASAGTVT